MLKWRYVKGIAWMSPVVHHKRNLALLKTATKTRNSPKVNGTGSTLRDAPFSIVNCTFSFIRELWVNPMWNRSTNADQLLFVHKTHICVCVWRCGVGEEEYRESNLLLVLSGWTQNLPFYNTDTLSVLLNNLQHRAPSNIFSFFCWLHWYIVFLW